MQNNGVTGHTKEKELVKFLLAIISWLVGTNSVDYIDNKTAI